MTTIYDLDVSGSSGKPNPITPINGIDGTPLGPDGNGSDCVTSWSKCVSQAGPGKPGNAGTAAPSASCGANGQSSFSVVITCQEFSGSSLTLSNKGGDGAPGNDGGKGGNGSDGGNAGSQEGKCTDFIRGGIGGSAGSGGNAGSGGAGGNAGAFALVYGSGFTSVPVSVFSQGGTGGVAGKSGGPGVSGQGGLNSDNSRALSGGAGSYGIQGSNGPAGFVPEASIKQDDSVPKFYLKISVQTAETV